MPSSAALPEPRGVDGSKRQALARGPAGGRSFRSTGLCFFLGVPTTTASGVEVADAGQLAAFGGDDPLTPVGWSPTRGSCRTALCRGPGAPESGVFSCGLGYSRALRTSMITLSARLRRVKRCNACPRGQSLWRTCGLLASLTAVLGPQSGRNLRTRRPHGHDCQRGPDPIHAR